MTTPLLPTFVAFLLFFFVVFAVGFLFWFYACSKYNNRPVIKKIFLYGLTYKILMGLAFAFVYIFYYEYESDTFYYFRNACYLGEMLFTHPKAYFMMLFDLVTQSNIYELGNNVTYMPHFNDTAVYSTHRYFSLFTIIGLKNYFITSVFFNTFLFILNWKVFIYFSNLLPKYSKIIAISLLFIPSSLFWSSGILKDSFTYSFSLLFVVYFHKIFFTKKFGIINLLTILFAAYILLSLKPYVLYASLVSCFVWLGLLLINKVRNKIVRVFVFPVILLGISFVGLSILSATMDVTGGSYGSVEDLLNKASVSSYDLKQDYYQGASFDIGDYEPTIKGALSVAPKAVIACLYRPYLWEINTLFMALSSIENTVLIFLSLMVIFRVGFIRLFKTLKQYDFLVFCIVFSISFSIGVGLSTSNFGALVRFKIPMLPFIFMFLLIVLKEHFGTAKNNVISKSE